MDGDLLQQFTIYVFPVLITLFTWGVVILLIVSSDDEESLQDLEESSDVDTEMEGVHTSTANTQDVSESEKPSTPESLSRKLSKSRKGFFTRLKDVFGEKSLLDDDMVEELEAILVSSDIGVSTTSIIIERLKRHIDSDDFVDQSALLDLLKSEVTKILKEVEEEKPSGAIHPVQQEDGPMVVMLVGVNGAGKTTTAAKLAGHWKEEGKSVLMVAGDTFRAAAVEQLKHWGERLGVPVIYGDENAKPSTVVFSAMERGLKDKVDVILVDTAGRLHTKSNLMKELEGLTKIMKKHQGSAPHETLLVVDGASGQNAIQQAREFHGATALSGVIVTKLDGTPRGGTVVAIAREIGIPVRYIGVGEGQEDLREFDRKSFVEAFFDPQGLTLEKSTLSANAEKRVRKRRRRQA